MARSVTSSVSGKCFGALRYKDRNLFAASQAGLVNNLNFGMSWGIFPLLYAGFGLAVGRIGILNSVYPACGASCKP